MERSESSCARSRRPPSLVLSWDDAVAFCTKLSAQESIQYRLPSEAEWEYACRGGSVNRYSFGDNSSELGKFAWFNSNALNAGEMYAHQIGRKLANGFGLHDMSGNVEEWCSDWYGRDYYNGSPNRDPLGPDKGTKRVLRGGSWFNSAKYTRSASRSSGSPDRRKAYSGFRVLRSLIKLDPIEQARLKKEEEARVETVRLERARMAKRIAADKSAIYLKQPDVTNSMGMKFRQIPAGEFLMGSPVSEEDRGDDETQHRVEISRAFHLGKYEVTQGQWKQVMGTAPWKGKQFVKEDADHPAVYVSWDDAVAFCKKLSKRDGMKYRLPTEAEWEYACRGGSTSTYHFGDDDKDLYKSASFGGGFNSARMVGEKPCNNFGLYDMHANVYEWCNDWYQKGYYQKSPRRDPDGPNTGSSRVLRGGSFSGSRDKCRSAHRVGLRASTSSFHMGFRVVLVR